MGLLVKSFRRDLSLRVEEAKGRFGFLGDHVAFHGRAWRCSAVVGAEELLEVELLKLWGSVTIQMIVLKIEGIG